MLHIAVRAFGDSTAVCEASEAVPLVLSFARPRNHETDQSTPLARPCPLPTRWVAPLIGRSGLVCLIQVLQGEVNQIGPFPCKGRAGSALQGAHLFKDGRSKLVG